MIKNEIKIKKTEHVVDDRFFDVVGNEFKDHVKGLSEWLKNSVDAYIDKGESKDGQQIILRFSDIGKTTPVMECIDFVGTTSHNIENAFKRWGDADAAKRGKNIKVYGGHGNGGKFYMRQAFDESQFITYKNGLLNIFGFEKGKYGFAEGFEDMKMEPIDAMKYFEINDLPIPAEIKENILNNKTGFTVVRGVGPYGIKKKIKLEQEIDRLRNFPQARRILEQAKVSVIYNSESVYSSLKPDELDSYEGFEDPRLIEVPVSIDIKKGNNKESVELSNNEFEQGKLILRTSKDPLPRGSKLGELNRIDILGEIGVIASYQLYELGVSVWPQASFIYGECQVPILESADYDCVSNDRTKLIKNDVTNTLLEWISKNIDSLATEISVVEMEKQKASDKEITSKFNNFLNNWKNKHMKKILSSVFSDSNGGFGGGEGGGKIGSEVTLAPNGFDFKWPESEITVDDESIIKLKINVPDTLPIGTTIEVSVDDESVVGLDANKYYIKSENLKSTKDGKDVAFINISVVGKKINENTKLNARAGKLSSFTLLKVVEKKEGESGKSYPKVLLSSTDNDPLGLAPGGILRLSERESLIYQRPQDFVENIYWINTSSPIASKIIVKFNSDSIQWRSFLFERYIDIFIKEAIHELENKGQEFTADAVDQKISDVVQSVHESAKDDLDHFLFDESYVIK